MNIQELNEHLAKFVEDYYPEIDDDDRLDSYSTLRAIKRFTSKRYNDWTRIFKHEKTHGKFKFGSRKY